MRCGYFHKMLFFIPKTELVLQVLTAGILMWEGAFTFSERAAFQSHFQEKHIVDFYFPEANIKRQNKKQI